MSAPRRPPGRVVDGVLLLDKPSGISSNAALQAARRQYNALKAGHTGTLDPLATGLLPLCFGEATKFAGELLDADKSSDAVVQLGATTDTADAEGRVLQVRPVAVGAAQLEAALEAFRGDIMQLPPMHSALKRDGKPLYEYARAGVEVERSPRRVSITALQILDFAGDRVTLCVDCSKGTYVRTLAADIGEALGCGAHLAALRRTRIGSLVLGSALTLDELAALSPEARDARLSPADALLEGLEALHLDAEQTRRMRLGQALPWPAGTEEGRRRVYGEGRFLGLCRLTADGWLRPQRLLSEISPKVVDKLESAGN